jgi:NADH-quinone oxidoreductase E subunit
MQPFERPDPAHNPRLRDSCPLRKTGSPVVLSAEDEREVERLFTRYPTKQAAILPILWMIQEKTGWISEEAVVFVAQRCEAPLSHIYSVVSFYTMFNRAPVGRYHLQVCTNLSCQMLGAEHLLECLRKRLGIDLTETTPDGLFTLNEVECLAACEMAPMLQVNDDFVGPLDEQGLDRLIARLKQNGGVRPESGKSGHFGQT